MNKAEDDTAQRKYSMYQVKQLRNGMYNNGICLYIIHFNSFQLLRVYAVPYSGDFGLLSNYLTA